MTPPISLPSPRWRRFRHAFGSRSLVRLLRGAGLGLAVGFPAHGQVASPVPEAPILRITTEMHTAPIVQIDVDPGGRFLVTGSVDKSVRVWDLATGELAGRLYPPIGAGKEGRIHAVAISADTSIVAASGWTGYAWDQRASIYLFERRSGRLRRRIRDLPGNVLKLDFDAEGQRLAAALGARQGIRIFDAASGHLLARDTDYRGDGYGLDFDPRGRLVTSSLDGYLRLYDRRLRRLARVRAPGGEQPIGVAFSPDGALIAVGYHDTPYVDILAGDDLYIVRAAAQPDIGGALSQVDWSHDGQSLFAAGFHRRGGWHLVRRWTAAGRVPSVDLAGARDTVTGLRALPDGGLVLSAQDPAWRRLDSQGRVLLDRPPQTIDARGLFREFSTDLSGKTVRFRDGPYSRQPALFSVAERRYVKSAGRRLSPPRTEGPGLHVGGWQNGAHPHLNDRPLPLKSNETSRSIALHPDGEALLLGTDWYLRLYDSAGDELWRTSVPGAAWAVHFSGDGRLALAALSDGTLRWFRAADGEEVLAFFPHALDRRWVLWTPAGYYDASVGGEELISWHLNRGSDRAADLYPVQVFREFFHRPAAIDALFLQPDDAHAAARIPGSRDSLAESIRRLQPPVVHILSPEPETKWSRPSIEVEIELLSPSGRPVTAVHAYVDGQSTDILWRDSGKPPPTFEPGRIRFQVPVPPHDCAVGVWAETDLSVGEPDVVKVRRAGPALRTHPRLFLLAIGISDYADKEIRLRFAHKDAADIAEVWRRQKNGGLYKDVEEKILTNDQAIKDQVLRGLEWLRKNVRHDDVAILFLAGHGIQAGDDDFRFLLHDAAPDAPIRTRLAGYELRGILQEIKGKKVIFLDACHAGSLFRGSSPVRNNISRFINELTDAKPGTVVYAAAADSELAQELVRLQNGVFTKALVEGLSGAADENRDGAIWVQELSDFLDRRVRELTNDHQRPAFAQPQAIKNFPLALSTTRP